jgi:RNHCP domain
MRKSRKKLLHLEQQERYNKDLEYYEEERQARLEAHRKPCYKRASEEVFKCRHCHRFVCPLPCGGHYRNHCPFCLYSRHVDDRKPGDRMSTCGASMEPTGRFQRPNGEYVIVHRCLDCGFERFNRIAADDDFDLVLALPGVPPRTSRDVRARQVEEYLAEDLGWWGPGAEEAG